MATVTTTKQFHMEQLFELLGGDDADVSTNGFALDDPAEKEITVTVKGDGETPITQAELETLVTNYTYDPDYGKDPEEKDLDAIRTKAQAVYDGTDAFTDVEVQKILAAIVLQATR